MECLPEETAVALVQGELVSADAAAVHAHVDGCERCRVMLAALARMPTIRRSVSTEGGGGGDGAPPPLRIAERYDIGPVLGAGAMGIVYQARDIKLARVVALKRVRCDGILDAHDRLVREALAMAQLSHPSIITVFDAGIVDGAAYVVMELVDGETLRTWLSRAQPSHRAIGELFVQLAHGLAAAHAAGIVHGDFKPDNILVDAREHARIADFGLARTVADDGDRERRFAGTPAYMAPEVLDGERPSAASDQYAWAASLYEALAGERAYTGASSIRSLREAQRGGPPRLARGPARLARVVERGLAADPGARFPSMTAAAAALADVPKRRARRRLAVALGSAAVASGTLAWFVATQRGTAALLECSDGADALADVWSLDRATALKTAFAANGQPALGDSVAASLDGYADRWRTDRRAACEATRAGHQSGELLDRRMYCLDQHREAMRELVRVVGTLRGSELARAMSVVLRLPAHEACDDRGALLAQPTPPDDPGIRVVLQTLETQMQHADAEANAGRFDRARAIYDEVVAGAVRMSWPPLEAQAWVWIAHLELARNGAARADEALANALDAAARARDDKLVADTHLKMLVAVTTSTVQGTDANRMIKLADAAITRAGNDPEQRATYHHVVGGMMYLRYQRAEGARHLQQALAIWEALPGDHREPLSRVRIELANKAIEDADIPRALAELDRARSAMGEPIEASRNAATYFMASCLAHMYQVQLDRALSECTKARDLLARRYGPEHPDTAAAEGNLATVLLRKGEGAASLQHFEHSLAVATTAYGTDHPETMAQRKNLADALGQLGQHERARDHWRAMLEARQRVLGPDHAKTLETATLLATEEISSGDAAAGIARLEQTLPLLESKLGRTHDLTVTALNSLAMAYQTVGQKDRARTTLERARALLIERAGPDDINVGLLDYNIAEILRETGHAADALRLYTEAEHVLAKGLPPTHALFGHVLQGRGEALITLQRGSEAIAVLERAMPIRIAAADDLATSLTEIATADALLHSRGDRTRARKLLDEATQRLASTGPRGAPHRARAASLRALAGR